MLRLGKVWFETKKAMGGAAALDKYDVENYQVEYKAFLKGTKSKDDIITDVLGRKYTEGADAGKTVEQYYMEQYENSFGKKKAGEVSTQALLDAVRNDDVQFATMRPPGSRFSVLDRQIVITAPPELEQLATLGDPDVLDELVDLLDDPARAWAAAVVLAAVTGRDAKEVESFSARPANGGRRSGAPPRSAGATGSPSPRPPSLGSRDPHVRRRRVSAAMRAVLFEGVGRPLDGGRAAGPRTRPGQLRLRVEACGICRTDLHLLDGEVIVREPPRVLGHQIVGVDERGAALRRSLARLDLRRMRVLPLRPREPLYASAVHRL